METFILSFKSLLTFCTKVTTDAYVTQLFMPPFEKGDAFIALLMYM